MKTCSKCKVEKSETEFYKNLRAKDLLRYSCKTCFKDLIKKRTEKLNICKQKKIKKTDNPNYQIEYRTKNKDLLSYKRKEYYLKNKDELLIKNNQYYIKNKKSINKKTHITSKKRIDNCSLLKSKKRISDLIRNSIKNKGYTKKSRSFKILGCEFLFFKEYIESQFKKDMNWNNIHLDHIYPVSLAKDEKHLIELNHYTNFQPLLAKDNLSKSNKLIEKQLRIL